MRWLRREDEREQALVQAQEERARAEREADLERRDRALEVTSLQVDLECARDELSRARADLAQHRELAARLARARQAEREWSRELRGQLRQLAEQRGALGENQSVQPLLLKTAMRLVEAKKGLLLSHADEREGGDLELQIAEGFEHDAQHSAVVQRFGKRVLAENEIVREDAPTTGPERTPADQEIETLVAIPVYLHDRFHGVVICANREGGFEALDDELLLALGDHAGTSLQGDRLRRELAGAHQAALRMLGELLAAGDPVRHSETAELIGAAKWLAEELELDEHQRETLLAAVLVRDLGLLALPDDLLGSPGPLSSEQRAAVELHPRIAFNVLHQVPALREVASAVLHHHERYDGRGYPAGLAGDSIPRLARVIAVLDMFCALTHDRPQRPALPTRDAAHEIAGAAGTQLDPEVAQLLIEHVHRVPQAEGEGSLTTANALAGFDGLASTTTDALTLLGTHRAFAEHVQRAAANATPAQPLVVAMIELDELARVNQQTGYAAGDRIIQLAARHTQRVAARLGLDAFRESGRRLALAGHRPTHDLETQLQTEFAGGPTVRIAITQAHAGEPAETVIKRARDLLL